VHEPFVVTLKPVHLLLLDNGMFEHFVRATGLWVSVLFLPACALTFDTEVPDFLAADVASDGHSEVDAIDAQFTDEGDSDQQIDVDALGDADLSHISCPGCTLVGLFREAK
jgi:hypothetical protein